MAIYTQYGRYLKAKQFKEMLEKEGDTYMLFGLGNPQWNVDNQPTNQDLPVAAYNTDIMSEGTVSTNQFYDKNANQYFQDINATDPDSPVQRSILNGDPDQSTNTGKYMYKCRRLIPPFPCIWQNYDNDNREVLNSVGNTSVTQDTYQNYYIQKQSNNYVLYDVSGQDLGQITKPQTSTLDIQYFTEMYIRGKAIENGFKAPVGLLGAVKCDINFVKDIGGESDNQYTGNIDQFWYGDRYWQIVRPDESDLDNYIHEDSASESDKLYNNQTVYPYHIIFTATVNPRVLCDELLIDQYLVPRQIAIFTRKRSWVDSGDSSHTPVIEPSGKPYYRAYQNVFNFGQYTSDEIADLTITGEILNFTLPCSVGTNYSLPQGEFKFLLHDCIKGQIREAHSADRFGYVVSF